MCSQVADSQETGEGVLGSHPLHIDRLELIDVRPGVLSGKLCFVGTRIAVYDTLEPIAGGPTTEEIVADFPELMADHVRAALEFAAKRERRLAASA